MSQSDPHATLQGIQATLAAASRAAWSRVESDVRERAVRLSEAAIGFQHSPGVRLVFHGLDPTSQRFHPVGRAIVVSVGSERFVIPIDDDLAARVAQLREAQALFGWPIGREPAWHAVGEIVQTHQTEPVAPTDPSREHDLVLHDIYVPDQILVDAERQIPGLDAAIAALDALQRDIHVPADASPEALVGVLLRVLETHHWRAFSGLCDEDLSQTDRRMAFEQFVQAWASSRGSITLVGVEGDPSATGDGAVVRTRLERIGQKGEALSRPLRWVRTRAGWRYAGGIL